MKRLFALAAVLALAGCATAGTMKMPRPMVHVVKHKPAVVPLPAPSPSPVVQAPPVVEPAPVPMAPRKRWLDRAEDAGSALKAYWHKKGN
jgi:hypothetical protein